ncbi:glycosyltransferase family 4 protein [Peribacillus frigoritolerans]|uniref:glycosyltransferase family 4 protein n=1 Tax=Peribacillus frigoritolerans TaxID=450367 RepID=UPI00399FF701
MRILHLCSYYIGNKLYKNLIKQISLNGVKQEVFIPIKSEKYIGKNQLSSEFNTINYYYRDILKKWDRLLFYNKIMKQMKEVNVSISDIEDVQFIHAHTLFSDGGTAYKLHQKYGINYMVNVRNTDLNFFYKYFKHLRPFMYKILFNASVIVFISHAYKQKMLSLLPRDIVSQIESKCLVIPNGIEDFWHENSVVPKKINNINKISLLFIGLINKNKNLKTVIYACAKLRDQGLNVNLDVIGNGPLEEEIKILCRDLDLKNVVFHGYLSDEKTISGIMDKSDIFVMPSFNETFGLVYIEAMSRGIPVIYSRGQAIDGFFNDGEVGYAVDSTNNDMIIKAIKKIMANYNQMSIKSISNSKEFNWTEIGKQYINLYKNFK